MNLDDYIDAVPKVDTHSHLVGCIRPSTLQELFDDAGAALPRPAAELYPYENFYEFIDIYNRATRLLRTREQFARIIYEALEDALTSSNQLHTEMFFNPQYSMEEGVSYQTVIDGLCDGVRAARGRLGVSCLLIPSFSREIDARGAEEVFEAILAHRRDEVAGIGIDGPERAGPPERFADIYRRAGRAGLKRTAHVCEDNQTLEEAPPSNYATCSDLLGCDRYDHGYNLLASPDMIRKARDEGRYFTTVALTSSAQRRPGRWKSIARMVDEGLRITVNTDNPSMFGTNLSHSYRAVCAACGWSHGAVRSFSLAGVDSCWLDESDKRALRARFEQDLAALDAKQI